MDDEKYLYVPLSLLFVTLSENHEQISFAYPFQSSKAVNCGNILQIDCSSLQKPISNFYALRDEKNKGFWNFKRNLGHLKVSFVRAHIPTTYQL